MDIRFVTERIEFGLDRGNMFWDAADAEPSPYWMTGFACARIEDRFGPPPEWGILDTKRIWAMERAPLATTVVAVSDELWAQRFVEKELSWPTSWMVDESGAALEPELIRAIHRAHAERAAKSHAMVHYIPPPEEDEYSSFRDRRDAMLAITLRMTDHGLRNWNGVAQRFLGVIVPSCAVTVSDVMFAHSDVASADTGSPTWGRFTKGHLPALAFSGFSLKVS